MKRVLILHSQVPFQFGGAEVLVNGLRDALVDRGHEADIVSIPYQWNPPEKLLSAALVWRLIDIEVISGEPVDIVICTKYPTWAVKHPNKVAWLVHQHRQAYDLYGSEHSEFGPDRESEEIRQRIIEIDRVGFAECRRVYAISGNVAKRLARSTGVQASTLYPPVPLDGLAYESSSSYILSVARLDALKRIDLLVRAMKHIESDLHCVIASHGPERDALEQYVREHNLSDRISFVGRVSDAELVRLYNNCRAVYYAPIDEDYGYTTVEALSAGKPVITTDDSGGVLEFITHEASGLISKPDPLAIASSIDRVADEAFARSLGSNGRALVTSLSWDNVVSSLIGER